MKLCFLIDFCFIRQANRLKPSVLAMLDKVVWFICTARNAIVVIVCLLMAAVLDPDIEECMQERENCTFTLTGGSEYMVDCSMKFSSKRGYGVGDVGQYKKHPVSKKLLSIILFNRLNRCGLAHSSTSSVWNLCSWESDRAGH